MLVLQLLLLLILPALLLLPLLLVLPLLLLFLPLSLQACHPLIKVSQEFADECFYR
jgi:hypothetical protein